MKRNLPHLQKVLEEDSTSDTPTETAEDSQPTEIHQVHNIFNNTMHDEDDPILQDKKLLTTNFEVKVEN